MSPGGHVQKTFGQRRDVRGPPQALDVGMAPQHAAARAGSVEQDAVERPTVPPAGGFGGVGAHQFRREPEAVEVLPHAPQAVAVPVHGDQL